VGAGRAADLRFIESVARTIAEHAESDKIIVEKSTIPVKTAESIKTIDSMDSAVFTGSPSRRSSVRIPRA
jgi:UDPglucose 6-dehydrogenase